MQRGIVSPLPPSAPLTRATASTCSLPTPTATEYGSSQNGINGIGGENERPSANKPSLTTMARHGRLPTPMTRPEDHRTDHDMAGSTLMEAAAALIPTPTASNARQGGRRSEARQEGPNLIEWAQRLPTPVAADSWRGSGSYARGNQTLLGAVGVKPTRLPTPSTRPENQAQGRGHTEERSGTTLREAAQDLATERGGLLPTPVSRDHKGTGYSNQLPTELARLQARANLPTPTAKDSVASGVAGNWTEESGRNPGATLTDVVVRGLDTPSRARTSAPAPASSSPDSSPPAPSAGTGGQRLSPCFVEWMMTHTTDHDGPGFPYDCPGSGIAVDDNRGRSLLKLRGAQRAAFERSLFEGTAAGQDQAAEVADQVLANVKLTRQQLQTIDTLRETGLWGADVGAVAAELLGLALRDAHRWLRDAGFREVEPQPKSVPHRSRGARRAKP